jgi:ABC-type dipeptide/oligopeptide/nickel transport system permease component
VLAVARCDPIEGLAHQSGRATEVRAALRVKFGFDDPMPVRYVRWLAAMA